MIFLFQLPLPRLHACRNSYLQLSCNTIIIIAAGLGADKQKQAKLHEEGMWWIRIRSGKNVVPIFISASSLVSAAGTIIVAYGYHIHDHYFYSAIPYYCFLANFFGCFPNG
jgi:hypothetical protein